MSTTPQHRRHPARRDAERGDVAIQMIVMFGTFLAILWLAMQAGLMFQGRSIALAAAQEGARAAAAEQGTVADGQDAAYGFVQSSTDLLRNTAVSGSRTADEATFVVRANTLSVFPGWKPSIEQTASMPIERITG